MAECKLIALDLDGTLTDSDKKLPKGNFDVLMALQQRGVKLALASGRPTYGISHLAHELKLKEHGGYILAYNGGMVIDCATHSCIEAKLLPRHLLPELQKASKHFGAAIITYNDAADTILADTEGNKWIEHEAWLNNNMKLQFVADLDSAAPQQLPKCLMVGEPDHMAQIEPQMRDMFPMLDIYRSSPFFLEIVPKGVDKAAALSKLCASMGITAQNLVAMGDGYNDLSMVKYAGIGVAMANGCDAVKEAADFVSLSNDECGVAYAIEKLKL